MKKRTEITRYRLERWLARFDEAWESLLKWSLFRPKRVNLVGSLPDRFPDLFSLAVERYLKRLDVMTHGHTEWGRAYFFGVRGVGCPGFTSQDAWDLATSFPLEVDFSEQDFLCGYIEALFVDLSSTLDLLLAGERVLSLMKMWNVGMDPELLSILAPRCGERLFKSLQGYPYEDEETRYRVMIKGVGFCIHIYTIANEAYECCMEAAKGKERAAADKEKELHHHWAVIDGFHGTQFLLESQERFQQSRERSSDEAAWVSRLTEAGLLSLMQGKTTIQEISDIEHWQPIRDDFLEKERERVRREVSERVSAIRSGDAIGSFADLELIIRNLELHRDIHDELIDDWLPRLVDSVRAILLEKAARKMIQDYLDQMVPILGESVPIDGFELDQLQEIRHQARAVTAARPRVEQFIEELKSEKSRKTTVIPLPGK